MFRRFASASGLVALTLLGANAAASPTFPAAVQDHLDLTCKPDCTTCHTRPEGGLGTARQPFGLAMQRAGLTAGQPSKIPAALDRLEDDSSDVDADGTTDIEELVKGTNPNLDGDEPLKCLDESTGDGGGCALERSGRARAAGWLVAGLLLAAAWRKKNTRDLR